MLTKMLVVTDCKQKYEICVHLNELRILKFGEQVRYS